MTDINPESASPEPEYNLRAALESAAEAQETGEQIVAPETQADRDRARDEQGRFAKEERERKDAQKPAPEDAAEPKGDAPAEAAKDAKPADAGPDDAGADKPADAAQTATPPPGWSVASKSEWAKLPESVRSDIAKREAEVNEGFKQYSGMKEIVPYAQTYAQQGTTVKNVLEDYHRVANALQTKPIEAISEMCRRAGVDPAQVGMALAGQQRAAPTPQPQINPATGQPYQAQQHQQPDPLLQHLTPLQQKLEQLERQITDRERADQAAETQRAQDEINSFASNPKFMYFENVRPRMGKLLSDGEAQNLEEAYEMAIWASPEIRPLLIKQQLAEAATRTQQSRQTAVINAQKANKSITGAPTPGASSANGAKPQSLRGLLEAGVQEQASGV